MVQFTDLIQQNIAPENVKCIGVYNNKGVKIGEIELGNLKFPDNLGEKLYSFGALSDIHISMNTAENDFRRALRYFQDVEKVDFVCIAGDLTQYSEDAEWSLYKKCVSEESANTPVYAILGNHDCYGRSVLDTWATQQIGYGLYHTFTKGDDVFIMLSSYVYPSRSGNLPPFYTTSLQHLYNTLEENRNKRCFVFQHYFTVGNAGDPMDVYGSTTLFGNQETVIKSLMEHYPNTLWFHGHSHHMFENQSVHDKANYDLDFGCHNIHIPSCYCPIRFNANGTKTEVQSGSQGYVVDVYDEAVVLRGIDFVTEELVPVAIYCFDTTTKDVSAGTYEDSTGIIK